MCDESMDTVVSSIVGIYRDIDDHMDDFDAIGIL